MERDSIQRGMVRAGATYAILACTLACTRVAGHPARTAPAVPPGGAVEDLLHVELPAGAQREPEPVSPRTGCEASRSWAFTAGGQAYRLVEARLGRTAAAERFAVQIKQVILAAQDQLSAAQPRFVKLDMSPGFQGVLAAGTLPIEGDKGWLLAGIAYLRHPGGELFSLELLQRGEPDAGPPSIAVLESIASRATPGTKAPGVVSGVQRLRDVQLNVPLGFMLECNAGSDYDVYNVRKVQDLAEAEAGHLFFYVGCCPQGQRPGPPVDRPGWAAGARQEGEIGGHSILWRLLQPDGVIDVPHLGASVELGVGKKADLRVVCGTAEECATLQGIAETLAPAN